MTSDTANGTKGQERTGVVIIGSGPGHAITDYHLAASGAFGLLPLVGAW
jgi:hypothetical protein